VNHRKIRSLREGCGLTQEQAAKGARMSGKQHWSNIESGRQKSRSISVELLERIASVLNVSPCDLLSPRRPRR
jgi:transcriptional regulator with XRE-family HTH domain